MSRPTPSSNALKLSEVMESGKYSDLTFVCAGKEFKVHKVIVCSQSDVLSAAVDGSFKEAKTGVIDMNAFKVEAVGHMVEFMYTGDYGTESTSLTIHPHERPGWRQYREDASIETRIVRRFLHHVWTNAIADYYNIGSLAELTRTYITGAYPCAMNSAEWTEATKQALEHTGDKAFHDTLARLAAKNISDLLRNDGIQEVIDPFALKIIHHIISSNYYIGC